MIEKTIKNLRSEHPEEIAVNNPLDIWGDADYLRYDIALKHLTEDKNIDIILWNILFQTGPIDEKVVEVLKKYKDKKPIFVMCYGGNYTKEIMEKIGYILLVIFYIRVNLSASYRYSQKLIRA